MAKRKVIEDSDDEDDTISNFPPKKAIKVGKDNANHIEDPASSESESLQQSAKPSTGSTGMAARSAHSRKEAADSLSQHH